MAADPPVVDAHGVQFEVIAGISIFGRFRLTWQVRGKLRRLGAGRRGAATYL